MRGARVYLKYQPVALLLFELSHFDSGLGFRGAGGNMSVHRARVYTHQAH